MMKTRKQNIDLAQTIANVNSRSFNCPECDKYHFDCTSDCVDSAMDAINYKDSQPIIELGGWHKEQPTQDCFVLLMTPEFPKNCVFIVAEWDHDAKMFYEESSDMPVKQWDCWKLIQYNWVLENPKYSDTLKNMAISDEQKTQFDEKATETK